MPQDTLKNQLRLWIIYAVVASHVCLVMLIGAAMTRASQNVLRLWVAGIIGGIIIAALLGAWRATLSANDSFSIAMAASGSQTKARAIWAGQCISLGIPLLHFFDIIKFPGEIFLGAIVTFIGLGVWARLMGERALRDAIASSGPPAEPEPASLLSEPSAPRAQETLLRRDPTPPQGSSPSPATKGETRTSSGQRPAAPPRQFGRRV
jgi:hypothetical protein